MRRKRSSSAPADEGDELLDYECEEMALAEKDQDLSEGDNSDEDQVPNEAPDKTLENNGDQGKKQQSNHTSSMLQLAPLCENEDLKYVVARRNIKKRIEMERRSSTGGSVTELTQSKEKTHEQALNGNTFDNLFENLFD